MSSVPNVLLADDHEPLRRGVRDALERSGFRIVAEAADASSAVVAALALKPDLCLLDIHMPGNGITAARAISDQLPQTAIVMLTVSHSEEEFFAAIEAGAKGFLWKDIEPPRLGEALHGVLADEAALPRQLVASLIGEFHRRVAHDRGRRELRERGVALTPRESEVLDLLADGLTTQEIAARLVVTPATARSHIAALLRKLGAHSRSEAIELLR